ncbi:serine hydrolase domain-containing protein [Flocculibacter collagenilyticus]|uniref:serine hydrolase domain-containing protein n=1 Tax=Flocculibacter collagenilyticus TaxID=2744479 RepID=UPI0018F27E32|nr:serine hydrolase domain-containing protein [Flocculibacter collagenilyticus]
MNKINGKNGLVAMLMSLSLLTGCDSGSSNTSNSTAEIVKAPEEVQQSFDYQAAIDSAISDAVPGIVLLVETPESRFLGAAGLADIETQTPMQTYHVMPTGSAGKKLTALLTVLLEQEGLLSLDAKINTFLDAEILSQIENSDQITIRQLLNNTSGVYNYLDEQTATDYYSTLLTSDLSQLKLDPFALAFALNKPAYAMPGEAFNYSNTGYLLVGLILDKLLGEHHSAAMRERIIEPLGMNSSFYGGVEKQVGDIISGYYQHDTFGTLNTKPFYESIGYADAPLRSNVEDLAALLKHIVSPDSVFSQEVQSKFFEQASLVKISEAQEYGLGIYKERINNKTVYHHGGIEAGYSTTNIFIAETQTSITAFFNCGLNVQCEVESDKVVHAILNNELK